MHDRKRWQSLRDAIVRRHDSNVEQGSPSDSVRIWIRLLSPAILEQEVDELPVSKDEGESQNDASFRQSVKAGKARASEGGGDVGNIGEDAGQQGVDKSEGGSAGIDGGGESISEDGGEKGVDGDGEDEKVDDENDGEGDKDEDEDEPNVGEPREKKNRRYLEFDEATHFFWEKSVRFVRRFFRSSRLTHLSSVPTVSRRNGFVSATFTMRMAG